MDKDAYGCSLCGHGKYGASSRSQVASHVSAHHHVSVDRTATFIFNYKDDAASFEALYDKCFGKSCLAS